MKFNSKTVSTGVVCLVLIITSCATATEAVMPEFKGNYAGRQRVSGAENVTIAVALPKVQIVLKSNTMMARGVTGVVFIDDAKRSNEQLEQSFQVDMTRMLQAQGFNVIQVSDFDSFVYEDKVRSAFMLIAQVNYDEAVEPYKSPEVATADGETKASDINAVASIFPTITLTMIEPLSKETHWSKTLRLQKDAQPFYASTGSTGRAVAYALTGINTSSASTDYVNLKNATMTMLNRSYPQSIKTIGDSLSGAEFIRLVPGAMKTKSLRRY